MPKLIVSVLTSLDGYYEGPDKDLASMPFEDAFNTHNLGLLQRAGTLVYGSTWIFGAGFHLQRRTGLLASLMAGAAILNVALNVLLIPKYGLEGAVLATVGSYGVLTVVMVVLSVLLCPARS